MRDLYLTHLRAVLIIDDEDVQSVLAMLHHFSGDNQDGLLHAYLQPRGHREPRRAPPWIVPGPRFRRAGQSDVKGMVEAQSSTAVDLGEPWPFEPATMKAFEGRLRGL